MKGGFLGFGKQKTYEELSNDKNTLKNEIKDLIYKFNELQEVLRKDQTVTDPETIIAALVNDLQRDLSDDEKDKFRKDPRYKKLSESEIKDINTEIQVIKTKIDEKNTNLSKVNKKIKEKEIKQQNRDAETAQERYINSINNEIKRKENEEKFRNFVKTHKRKPYGAVLTERQEKIVKEELKNIAEREQIKKQYGGSRHRKSRKHRKSTKRGLRKRVHHTRRSNAYNKRSMCKHKNKHHRRSHRTRR